MTPDVLHTINAVSTLIDRIGSWPIGTVLLVILIGPWVFSLITSWNQQKRFDTMRQMYENNVTLVKSFDKLACGQNDVITLNTAKWSEALDGIRTNQFCPLNRTKKVKMEDVDK